MDEREVELIDYLAVLWRRKWLVAAGPVAGVLLALAVTSWMPKIYAVSATVEVGDIGEELSAPVERVVARFAAIVYFDEAGNPSPDGPVAVAVEYRKPFAIVLRGDTQAPARAAAVLQKVATRIVADLEQLIQVRATDDGEKVKDLQRRMETVQRESELVVAQLRNQVASLVGAARTEGAAVRADLEQVRQDRDLTQRYVESLRRALAELQRARGEALRSSDDPSRALIFGQLSSEIVTRENELFRYEQDLIRRFPAMLHQLESKEQALREQLAGLEPLATALRGRRATGDADIESTRGALYRATLAGAVDLRLFELGLHKVSVELPDKQLALQRDAERLNRRSAAIRAPRLLGVPEIPRTPIRPRLKLNLAVGGALGLFASVLLSFGVEYIRLARPRLVGADSPGA